MGTHPHFGPDEYTKRLARLREKLRAAGVVAGLFDEMEAMTWISGYGNSENRWRCIVVPVEGEPFFVIRALDATPCRDRCWFPEILTFRDWEDPMPVLADALGQRGLDTQSIGLDFGSYGMSVRRFEQTKALLPKVRFVDLGPLVWELRLLKSPAEIGLLRRAAHIADVAVQRAAAVCRPGGFQRDAARAAMETYMEMGADPGPPGPITAGRGWDFLHGHMGDQPLATGDTVHIELTPRIAGYSARIMRCASVGKPEAALVEATRQLRELQDRQIDAIRPGAVASEIDAILRGGVVAAGLRPSYDNITGYTLGNYHPAGPRTSDFTRIFHPKADWRVEPGMVFHIYASGGGASLSETVLATDGAPERLTRIPRELIVNG